MLLMLVGFFQSQILVNLKQYQHHDFLPLYLLTCMATMLTSSVKFSFSKPIASVFNLSPIIFFSYGVEIFPHSLVQLIAHVSALIGYIEMQISHHTCSFEFF